MLSLCVNDALATVSVVSTDRMTRSSGDGGVSYS